MIEMGFSWIEHFHQLSGSGIVMKGCMSYLFITLFVSQSGLDVFKGIHVLCSSGPWRMIHMLT